MSNLSFSHIFETSSLLMAPNDLHRIYVQCLLGRRAMKTEVAIEMYNRAIQICRGK